MNPETVDIFFLPKHAGLTNRGEVSMDIIYDLVMVAVIVFGFEGRTLTERWVIEDVNEQSRCAPMVESWREKLYATYDIARPTKIDITCEVVGRTIT